MGQHKEGGEAQNPTLVDWRVKGWARRVGGRHARPAPTAGVEKQGQGMALWASLAVVMLLQGGGTVRLAAHAQPATRAANWPSPLVQPAADQHAPQRVSGAKASKPQPSKPGWPLHFLSMKRSHQPQA